MSQRRRSDFIGEIGNFNGNRTLRYVVGENITDAQVSYSFGDSLEVEHPVAGEQSHQFALSHICGDEGSSAGIYRVGSYLLDGCYLQVLIPPGF